MRTLSRSCAALACACALVAANARAFAASQSTSTPSSSPISSPSIAAPIHAQAASLQQAGTPAAASLRGDVRGAVAELEQLRAEIAAGTPGALQRLLALTEAPLGDARARDERLEQLRGSLAQLEGAAPNASSPLPVSLTSGPDEALRPAPPTPGAGAQALAAPAPAHALAPALAPTTDPRSSSSAADANPAASALEGAGYCADRVRQGRAYYKAGLYERALSSLEHVRDEPQALHWRARCYERLGRSAEAIDAYERLIAHPGAGAAADLARADLDFLRWRERYDAPAQRGKTDSGARTSAGAAR